MKRKAEKIDSIVKSVIERLNRETGPTSDEIEVIWKEAAGEKAAGHSKPASLRRKKLVVNVDGSGWLYELVLRKGELLKVLKGKIGHNKIKELQFRIGDINGKDG